MELIPILSTIILVATISTFLLAIGAYVLYKIREARGQQAVVAVPSTIKAELLTPAEAPLPLVIEQPRPLAQPLYVEQPPIQYQPSSEQYLAGSPYSQARQFAEPGFQDVKNYQKPPSKTGSRYLKYTDEGYVPATNKKEDKNNGTLRWN